MQIFVISSICTSRPRCWGHWCSGSLLSSAPRPWSRPGHASLLAELWVTSAGLTPVPLDRYPRCDELRRSNRGICAHCLLCLGYPEDNARLPRLLVSRTLLGRGTIFGGGGLFYDGRIESRSPPFSVYFGELRQAATLWLLCWSWAGSFHVPSRCGLCPSARVCTCPVCFCALPAGFSSTVRSCPLSCQ